MKSTFTFVRLQRRQYDVSSEAHRDKQEEIVGLEACQNSNFVSADILHLGSAIIESEYLRLQKEFYLILPLGRRSK